MPYNSVNVVDEACAASTVTANSTCACLHYCMCVLVDSLGSQELQSVNTARHLMHTAHDLLGYEM
jgi:hypothetical protein